MQSNNHLQRVLECCYMILMCRTATAATYQGYNPMDAMVGEMDWAWELHTTLEEIYGRKKNSTRSATNAK